MKVSVNDKYKFDVENLGNTIKVDGSELSIDIRNLSATMQHLIYQNRSYNVELVTNKTDNSHTLIKVNGNLYRVNIENQYAELLKQLGIDNLSSNKVKEIRAPMPGLVLHFIVAEGQEVFKGDSLLVLEAMKMENIIKSPVAGLIKKILVQKGNKVKKNEILIQFA